MPRGRSTVGDFAVTQPITPSYPESETKTSGFPVRLLKPCDFERLFKAQDTTSAPGHACPMDVSFTSEFGDIASSY